jgi:hypothetical protein
MQLKRYAQSFEKVAICRRTAFFRRWEIYYILI